MEDQLFIKSEPDWLTHTVEVSNTETTVLLPSDNFKVEPADIFDDERLAVKEEHELQDDTDLAEDIKIEEFSIPELVPRREEIESPSLVSDGDLKEVMKEETHDDESDANTNHPNDFLNTMEEQLFITSEPDWLTPTVEVTNSETTLLLPSENLKDEAADIFDDKRIAVKEEHELRDDTDRTEDIKIEDFSIPDLVPRREEIEIPPLASDGDLKEVIKEETHDDERDANRNHPNELTCPDMLNPAAMKIYELGNGGKQYTTTPSSGKCSTKQNVERNTLSHSGNTRYTCKLCKRQFTIEQSYEDHMLFHSDKKTYSCTVCEDTFTFRVNLKTHMLTHSFEESYSCAVCEAKLSDGECFKHHMLIHSGERPYSCTVCEAKFNHGGTLKRHLLIHSSVKQYSCAVCEAKFTQRVGVKRHMLTHSGERPYACSSCEAKYDDRGNLVKHMFIHSGKKPYPCGVCEAKITHCAGLKRHMLIHSGERPYSCAECQATFTHGGTLRTHMLQHSGEKPYLCAVCKAKFTRREGLKSHMVIHTGEWPYSCSVCGAKFSNRGSFVEHMFIHSGEEPYSCGVCEAKFNQGSNLKTHMLMEMNGMEMTGRRPRGRPRDRWTKGVKKSVEERGVCWDTVNDERWWMDRKRWRGLCSKQTRPAVGNCSR